MGNEAPKKLSNSYPDVEVYHVRNVWMHFQKAYSLGAGTFGLVFAANPKTSKISKAISAAGGANDIKHTVPVHLGSYPFQSESNLDSQKQGTSSMGDVQLGDTLLSSAVASSTIDDIEPIDASKYAPTTVIRRAGVSVGGPKIVRQLSVDSHKATSGSASDEDPPFPKVGSYETVHTSGIETYPSSETSGDESDAKDGNAPKFGFRPNRGNTISASPYRISLAQRRERAQAAIENGDAVQMEVAVKVMTKLKNKSERKIQKSEFANEVRILERLLGYQGIVQFQGALVDSQHYCIVTEMCRGGELWSYLGKLPNHRFNELEASGVTRKILQALYFCHINGICHLDIKPENILLFNKNDPHSLKIVDFGCAKFTHDSKGAPVTYEEFKGSLDFAAPEVVGQYATVKGEKIKAVDMWSIGVLVFLMISGSLPFGKGSDSQKRNKIFKCEFEIPPSLKLSSSLVDFINRLLTKNADDRMTVTEALDHPWISEAETVASKESFDPMVLRGLQNYQNSSLLRKIVASLLVRAMTDKEKDYIHYLFNKYDSDGSGYLENNEVINVLKEAFALTDDEAKEEAAQVVENFDVNSDGVIGWEEFAELTFQGSLASDKSRIRKAFRLIDVNSDGVISIEELKKALNIGTEDGVVTEDDFYQLIKQIDENQDGVISFDEFSKGLNDESRQTRHLSRLPSMEEQRSISQQLLSGKRLGLHSRHKSAGT